MSRTVLLVCAALLVPCLFLPSCRKKTPAIEYATIVQQVISDSSRMAAAPAAKTTRTRALAPAICPIADTLFAVFAGLSLAYQDSAAGAEIAAKEEGLTVLLKHALAGKSLRQIDAGRVREQLIKDFNAFLSTGKITDITFTRFDIVQKGAP